MTTQNGRAFNEWLRAQLKAKKMSQRQLAQQSGVDHSTISRLIRGDRMPSLGTATKLARGLRELRDDADTPQYLGLVASGATNPTARVEYALRADELLSRAAGPADHGVLPRRPDAPLRPRLPAIGALVEPSAGPTRSVRDDRRRTGGRGSRSRLERPDGRESPPSAAASAGPAGPSARGGHRLDHPVELDHSLYQGTTRTPSTFGSRGQRTPASGAPAFAFARACGQRLSRLTPQAVRCRLRSALTHLGVRSLTVLTGAFA